MALAESLGKRCSACGQHTNLPLLQCPCCGRVYPTLVHGPKAAHATTNRVRWAQVFLALAFPITPFHVVLGPLFALVAIACGLALWKDDRDLGWMVVRFALGEIALAALLVGYGLVIGGWCQWIVPVQ